MTPLLGIGVCVSIQFGALEYAKRVFAVQNVAIGRGGQGGKTLTAEQLFFSGVFAGLANGVVSGPVEHIRIRKSTPVNGMCLASNTCFHLDEVYKPNQTLIHFTMDPGTL